MYPKFAGGVVVVVAAALLGTACVSFGVDSYEEFRSAVEAGAPCDELFDIKAGFEERSDLERIEADLDEIGCETPSSDRTDV